MKTRKQTICNNSWIFSTFQCACVCEYPFAHRTLLCYMIPFFQLRSTAEGMHCYSKQFSLSLNAFHSLSSMRCTLLFVEMFTRLISTKNIYSLIKHQLELVFCFWISFVHVLRVLLFPRRTAFCVCGVKIFIALFCLLFTFPVFFIALLSAPISRF